MSQSSAMLSKRVLVSLHTIDNTDQICSYLICMHDLFIFSKIPSVLKSLITFRYAYIDKEWTLYGLVVRVKPNFQILGIAVHWGPCL